jgi:tetratricopeptide (TPR) repeat protein
MTDEEIVTLANVLMAAERWEDVLSLIGPRREEGPLGHALLWSAGWSCLKLGHYGDAATLLHEAVTAGPVSHAYYAALGMALFHLGEHDFAELWLLRALAVRDSTLVRNCLALAYQKQSQWQMAEAVYHEGARIRPGDRDLLLAYASFLSDAGREEDAAELRQAADALPPAEAPTPADAGPESP